MRDHDAGHFAHDRHDHAVAELAIRLRIAHGNHEVVRKAHQACAFARREAPRPLGPYGITKLAGAELVLRAQRAGADAVVLRIFDVIGPGAPDTR